MDKIDTDSVRRASASRHAVVEASIAQILGKDVSHNTVERIAAVVTSEVRHTHSMYEGYVDFLTDRANGYAVFDVVVPA